MNLKEQAKRYFPDSYCDKGLLHQFDPIPDGTGGETTFDGVKFRFPEERREMCRACRMEIVTATRWSRSEQWKEISKDQYRAIHAADFLPPLGELSGLYEAIYGIDKAIKARKTIRDAFKAKGKELNLDKNLDLASRDAKNFVNKQII